MRNKYTHHHLQQQEQEQDHHQHQHQHQKKKIPQRSKFLPTLCSSTTKQVITHSASHRQCSSTSTTSSPFSTASEDPLSPRVGCMGQVKRNNRVGGLPPRTFVGGFPNTTAASTTTSSSSGCAKTTVKSHDHINNNSYYSSSSIVKYQKLKRFFSTTSPTTAYATTAVGRSGAQTQKSGRITTGTHIKSRKNRGIVGDDDHIHGTVPRSKIDANCGGAIGSGYKKNDKGSFVNLMDMDPPLPVVKQNQQQEQKQGKEDENMNLWRRRSRGAPLKSLQLQLTHHHTTCNLLLQPTTV